MSSLPRHPQRAACTCMHLSCMPLTPCCMWTVVTDTCAELQDFQLLVCLVQTGCHGVSETSQTRLPALTFSFLSLCGPQLVFACKGHNLTEDGDHLRTFKLFRRLYKYSSEQGTFQHLPAMPRHLPDQICRALESLRLVNTAGMLFRSWSLN